MIKDRLPVYHGTARGYVVGRCRCATCKEAYRVYRKKHGQSGKPPAHEGGGIAVGQEIQDEIRRFHFGDE